MCLQHGAQASPHQRMIVRDQDARSHKRFPSPGPRCQTSSLLSVKVQHSRGESHTGNYVGLPRNFPYLGAAQRPNDADGCTTRPLESQALLEENASTRIASKPKAEISKLTTLSAAEGMEHRLRTRHCTLNRLSAEPLG